MTRILLTVFLLALASGCDGNPFGSSYRYCPLHVETSPDLTIRMLGEPRTVSIYGSIRLVELQDGVEVTSPGPVEANLHWDLGLYSVSSAHEITDLSQGGSSRITIVKGQAVSFLGFSSGGQARNVGAGQLFPAYLFTCASLENEPRLQITSAEGKVARLTELRVLEQTPVNVSDAPEYFRIATDYYERVSESQGMNIIATFTVGE